MSEIDWTAHARALGGLIEAIGRTPLVRLRRVTADVAPAILMKLEWYGPTGSLKDRIYLRMFTEAERKVLFCTVNRPDVNAVRAIVAEIDPGAFVVIGQGHQASGGVLRNVKR